MAATVFGAAPEPAFSGIGPLSPALLLSKLEQRIALITNFACHRQTNRYSQHGSDVRQFDVIDLDVNVVDHSEEYSGIFATHQAGSSWQQKNYRTITDLPKPWFSGELVTILEVIREQMSRNPARRAEPGTIAGKPVVMFEFHVPASSGKWFVYVRSQPYPLDFTLRAWFSATTGDLVKSLWSAQDPEILPADSGIRAIVWTTRFQPATIAGVTEAVPGRSLYQVFYSGKEWRVDWTENTYTDFRRFGSTSALRFEQP
jgi:hypothetical protein